MRLRETDIGWPLEELWVGGQLLEGPSELEAGSVVLVLNEPGEELPWMALHSSGEWIGEQLRMGKRPMLWCYRPAVYPAWNHRHRRVLRFWSAEGGLDEEVIEALRQRRLEGLAIFEPSDEELAGQLEIELEYCRRHLRQVLDGYWEYDWRRDHKGFGVYPENHLVAGGRGRPRDRGRPGRSPGPLTCPITPAPAGGTAGGCGPAAGGRRGP